LISRIRLPKSHVLIAERIRERAAALNHTRQLIEIIRNVRQRRWAAVRRVLDRVGEMLHREFPVSVRDCG
jgi:hypothetical protein